MRKSLADERIRAGHEQMILNLRAIRVKRSGAGAGLTWLRSQPKISPFYGHGTDRQAGGVVSDWRFAQKHVSEELAEMHLFSFKQCNVDFVITVREFAAPPPGQHVRFFAQADKMVNQKVAPFLPAGWGTSLLDALTGCTRTIREFPCDEE